MNFKGIFLFFFFTSACFLCFSQNLKLPVTNYTTKEYGRGYEPVNFAIIHDNRDIIYAGNANGILEYDGSYWDYIPVRSGVRITSFAINDQGTIFVGSQNEFGLLAPDPTGQLRYYSLSDSLDEMDRFFTTIWKTYVNGEKVYFQSYENIFIYEKGELAALYPETSFHTSFMVEGVYYVRQRQKGLLKLTEEGLQMVPGGEYFSDMGIFAMLPLDNNKIFIATQEQGFFILDQSDTSNPLQPLKTSNDSFLVSANIIGGIRLNDNHLAFNSLSAGIIITDQKGEIRTIINKKTGLQVDDVKQIVQDCYGNIWCALNNGISKVDYTSPFTYYKEESGINGNVHCVVRFQDKIYVGTSNGLFYQKESPDVTSTLEFEVVSECPYQVWNLLVIDHSLLAATDAGLFQVTGSKIRQISDRNTYAMCFSEELNILFAGGLNGLSAFRNNNGWKLIKVFEDIHEDIKGIEINKSTLSSGTELWLGTSFQGAIKVIIHDDLTHTTRKYYGKQDGLNEDWILPFSVRDTVCFGTRTGLLGFVDEELIKESLPDSLKDREEFTRGFFEGRSVYNHDITTLINIVTEAKDRTWLVIDNQIGYILKDMPDTIIQRPFMGIDQGKINKIFPDKNLVTWIGAADGLIRFDQSYSKNFDQDYHCLIRNVRTSGDSVLFNGTYYSTTSDVLPFPGQSLIQNQDMIPRLKYSFNNLNIRYTAPFFDDENKNVYSYKLAGHDQSWSEWSSQKTATYTNLHEGEYTFQVRAKNVYDHISAESAFTFTVLAPWYRTLWAAAGYFILFLLIIYVAIQVSIYRLRKKNEKLEQVIRQRTAEIRAKNIELERQQKEITDSIQYAQRIQNAVLPSEDHIRKHLSEYFILLKPRNIVSGDFYWLSDDGNRIIIIAADCTGHGVPGAFMSMLGVSLLNKIVLEEKIVEADKILNHLRNNVITSMQQSGKEGETKDGMDIALCVIDLENKKMQFAGAHNPLYMIRSDQLIETKADRMPVAFYEKISDFTSHEIILQSGDTFYMFSDGFADQFGGPEGKKFKYKAFKELLINIQDKPMQEQRSILDETLEKWKEGPTPEGKPYDQVDDILVVGVRI